MSENPQKDKSWLDSDIYDKPKSQGGQTPRTSIFQFGTIGDLVTNGARLIGQYIISRFLFLMLLVLFTDPALADSKLYLLSVSQFVSLICITISVFLATRVFDGIDIPDMGLKVDRQAFKDFLFGISITFFIFAVEFLFYWATGYLKLEGVVWKTQSVGKIFWNLLAIFVVFIFVGWNEELLARGFHQRIISKGLNRPLGVILSAIIFSFGHRNNSNSTSIYLFFSFLVGVVLSFAFIRTSQLWLAIGIHAGWDIFVTIFAGNPISFQSLFHLFEYRIDLNPLFMYYVQFINLVIIIVAIRAYTSNRKVQIQDW